MSERIGGKIIAEEINLSVKKKIKEISSQDRSPKLVSLTVGESEDADIYVNMQKKAAAFVGVNFVNLRLENGITQENLFDLTRELNSDKSVTSVIVQKPLPDGFDHDRIVSSILPEKDAEGIHPYNLGKILRREADIVPCTPGAIMKILTVKNVNLFGKEVVIIGHSAIVGKPLSLMMLNEMATTTVCHIGTFEKGDLKAHARRADILVVAVGKAGLIKGDWIKEGAIVIDVGINKMDGKIVGDVMYPEVTKKAALITPVPGGVGPVTVSILMRNVLRSYMEQSRENRVSR